MTRRMSCALSVDAVLERRKTVTRRWAASWDYLKPGDRLILVEKAQGIPRGGKQRVLAEVEIVSNRLEPLRVVEFESELEAEGFPHLTGAEFVAMWCKTHGYNRTNRDTIVRRIEWVYL